MLKSPGIFLLGLLVVMSTVSVAQANDVSLVGALDWHRFTYGNVPSGTTLTDNSANLGYGGGVLLGFHLTPQFVVEPGFLYLVQKDTNTNTAPNFEDTTKEYQIPVVLRYWFSPYISVGVGGYYTFATGNIETTINGVTASSPYAGDLKKNDLGLIGSLGIHIPMGSMWNFVADGRYLYGLKDLNDGYLTTTPTNASVHNREIQALLGFAFSFGGDSHY